MLRIAISALSCCISRPVKCPAFVFAAIRIGITPVPVPISRTLSPGFAFANPESKTASIPKQNFFGFWMIWYPLLCRSSSLSSGYSFDFPSFFSIASSFFSSFSSCFPAPPFFSFLLRGLNLSCLTSYSRISFSSPTSTTTFTV